MNQLDQFYIAHSTIVSTLIPETSQNHLQGLIAARELNKITTVISETALIWKHTLATA
jgi:hypothetical protein